MINNNYIIIADFETSNLEPDEFSPIQLGAVVMNPRTLDLVPDAEFNIMMLPLDWDKVTDRALEINKKTREQIKQEGVDQKIAWEKFVHFVRKYDTQGKFWSRPVLAGHNNLNFDNFIFRALAKKYGQVDAKDGRQNLFHPIYGFDTLQLFFYWCESLKEPSKYNMDYLREYLGMSKESIEGGHDAVQDVKDTAAILRKFLQLSRKTAATIKFKDSFKAVAA